MRTNCCHDSGLRTWLHEEPTPWLTVINADWRSCAQRRLPPDIVLLDEPVAGMNEIESAELRETIRALHDFLGCGILVVDHDLSFILGLCHRIYVVDAGRLIATGSPDEIRNDPAVISAYIGSARVRHEPLANDEQA